MSKNRNGWFFGSGTLLVPSKDLLENYNAIKEQLTSANAYLCGIDIANNMRLTPGTLVEQLQNVYPHETSYAVLMAFTYDLQAGVLTLVHRHLQAPYTNTVSMSLQAFDQHIAILGHIATTDAILPNSVRREEEVDA